MSRIRELLFRHEGMKLFAYKCSRGKLTLGVGRNIDPIGGAGITKDEAMYLLENDIVRVTESATKIFPWFGALDSCRQDVILSMLFQLGLGGFMEFRRMRAAVGAGAYALAASEMLDSEWARTDSPARARELSAMMRTGSYAD